jgi:dTDP-glucose pyrophosphorylase
MVRPFLITKNNSVKDAMKQMNKIGEKALFIVDENNKLLGSLTDGDVRRWVLKEGSIKEDVDKVYRRNPLFVMNNYNIEEVKQLMLSNKIEWIPVINSQREIIEVLLWQDIFDKTVIFPKAGLDIPVAIMAGGKGTRLDPFTRILPKPLIPIGEKAIIDIIMDKFFQYGIVEFYIAINHKAKMIKAYFEEMNSRYTIHYIEEESPRGTAGSLRKLQGKIKDSLLVSNCDIIVDCDYTEVITFHNENNYDISIIGSFRHFTIPYGICEIANRGILKEIKEKPEYDFLVNTGLCVLRKNTLGLIPKNKKFHITDLIKRVKDNGGRVGVFPINEKNWIDVGQWGEYRKSLRLLGLEQ